MTCEAARDVSELEQTENAEDRVVRRGGVLGPVLRGLFWPFGIVLRAYRGFWWALGFRRPVETVQVQVEVSSPARHSVPGRKRMYRITRMLLNILPRWVQGALGYPVCSSIGRCLSPEIRVSPTKPCGKGSKRKQDELDEDEDQEEEHQTWVEVLNQELADDEDPAVDPDYEPSSVETASEEYCSRNDTESDPDVSKGIILDVDTGFECSTPAV